MTPEEVAEEMKKRFVTFDIDRNYRPVKQVRNVLGEVLESEAIELPEDYTAEFCRKNGIFYANEVTVYNNQFSMRQNIFPDGQHVPENDIIADVYYNAPEGEYNRYVEATKGSEEHVTYIDWLRAAGYAE